MGKSLSNRDYYLEEMAVAEVQSWLSILSVYRSVFSFLDLKLQQLGCSIPRFQILLILCLEEEETPVRLAKRMHVSRANISTFLKRLLNDNLIVKNDKESQKRPTYSLSKEGEKYLYKIFPPHIQDVKEVMVPFSKKQLDILNTISESIPE